MNRFSFASFKYAFEGIVHVFRTQPNARIHAAVTLVVIVLGVGLGISRIEWAVLVAMMAVVFAMEFVNTALEAVVDLATEDRRPLAKIAKDVAAGGVLIAALLAVVVGVLILGPLLWARLAGSY